MSENVKKAVMSIETAVYIAQSGHRTIPFQTIQKLSFKKLEMRKLSQIWSGFEDKERSIKRELFFSWKTTEDLIMHGLGNRNIHKRLHSKFRAAKKILSPFIIFKDNLVRF